VGCILKEIILFFLGSIPCLDWKFHSTVYVIDGQCINITVKFRHSTSFCNLPVISGHWSRINGYMPKLSSITNGTDYSTLSFYNISANYEATYAFTAVNQCGTKFIEVFLDVGNKGRLCTYIHCTLSEFK